MNTIHKQSGITLMEMTVVVAAVALLGVLGLPAISAFVNSLASSSGTKAMVSAALSSARAIAVKERHYAGIRFQKAYDPKGQLKAPQYMIFIIHDAKIKPREQGNLSCRAVEGIEPIKLPEAVGVMDLRIGKSYEISSNDDISVLEDVNDTTTFSIVFSPSGKLIIHSLWVRNRDGKTDGSSEDDVFNAENNVKNGIGMFFQDENTNIAPSRNSFIIYERDKFRAAFEKERAWTDYLQNLDAIYINPYVGTIIEK